MAALTAVVEVPSYMNDCLKQELGAEDTGTKPLNPAGQWKVLEPVASWHISNTKIWPGAALVRVEDATLPVRVMLCRFPNDASNTGVVEKLTVSFLDLATVVESAKLLTDTVEQVRLARASSEVAYVLAPQPVGGLANAVAVDALPLKLAINDPMIVNEVPSGWVRVWLVPGLIRRA